ncbi:N-glycosylase/DNA lyase [Trichinella spiralis]|uniref:N-glycosylase/DNA lyase n=1 Tax=Trichinella spiralis TaxID=6334 RepID=UPI0001EFC989|nr:N-glycosylase/DNA lyase [Trichinella spiralis]
MLKSVACFRYKSDVVEAPSTRSVKAKNAAVKRRFSRLAGRSQNKSSNVLLLCRFQRKLILISNATAPMQSLFPLCICNSCTWRKKKFLPMLSSVEH